MHQHNGSSRPTVRLAVYVDGFNLYHRTLKGSEFRWLNLYRLVKNLRFKHDELVKIAYFTARVKHRPGHPNAHIKQSIYIEALECISGLQVIYGNFELRHATGAVVERKRNPLTNRTEDTVTQKIAKVQKFEEKGSDVNLASQMLLDAHLDLYDVALLISNDTDLVAPCQMIKKHFNKKLYIGFPQIIDPSRKHEKDTSVAVALRVLADQIRDITATELKKSLFPQELHSKPNRTVRKPVDW